MQENMEYMIVNDQVYQEVSQLGERMYIYNYKINNPQNFELLLKIYILVRIV